MNNVDAGFSLQCIVWNNCCLRRLKSAATVCGYEIIVNTNYSKTLKNKYTNNFSFKINICSNKNKKIVNIWVYFINIKVTLNLTKFQLRDIFRYPLLL